ncbi:SsrA-binding protein [Maribacter caenipelagi]|uniref:SsrA-binding protein n=1 Tax=Maribacter caenipelagi TaxID=1447781 RepID=UPI0010614D7D|nr:SsrA-binding protein [Maribacter caenipelagi]
MKNKFYKLIAKLNKALLPSYSKQRLDLSKASKLQMALIGWRYFITTKALD